MKQQDNILIIDRIEGEYAVAETDAGMQEIPLNRLPEGVGEGSVLRLVDGAWVIDAEAKQQRQQSLFAKQQSLFKRK